MGAAHVSTADALLLKSIKGRVASLIEKINNFRHESAKKTKAAGDLWPVGAAGVNTAGALPGQEPGGEYELAARVKREGVYTQTHLVCRHS